MVARAVIAFITFGLATINQYAYAHCNTTNTRKRSAKDSRRLFMKPFDFMEELQKLSKPEPPKDGMTTEECIRYMERILLTKNKKPV